MCLRPAGALDRVLSDRIQFEPDETRRRYRLLVPVHFGRVPMDVVPELKGLQEMVSSPTGLDHILTRQYLVEIPAA